MRYLAVRCLLVILAFATLILPGIGHGLLTDRWFVSTELEEYTARLAGVPIDIQDWQGENFSLNPEQLAKIELTGYVARRYTHRTSRLQLSVLICCGRPGPISVHTPDVCYQGSGYRIFNAESKFSLNGASPSSGEFHEATFMKPGPVPEFLEVYWSWNSKGTWECSGSPRLAFGGQRALYKLYVVCSFSRDIQRKETQDACESFIKVLLPELKRSLF